MSRNDGQSSYGNLTRLQSPLNEAVIYTGADDGRVHVIGRRTNVDGCADRQKVTKLCVRDPDRRFAVRMEKFSRVRQPSK